MNYTMKPDAYIYPRQYGSGLSFVEPIKPENYDELENGEYQVIQLFSSVKVNSLIDELKISWHLGYGEQLKQINQLKETLKIKDAALQLALNICDSVPTKLHENGSTEVEQRIGCHVNNGQYQFIRDALKIKIV